MIEGIENYIHSLHKVCESCNNDSAAEHEDYRYIDHNDRAKPALIVTIIVLTIVVICICACNIIKSKTDEHF